MAEDNSPVDRAWETTLRTLSSRALRALPQMGIWTHEDFLRMSFDELPSAARLTPRTRDELRLAWGSLKTTSEQEKSELHRKEHPASPQTEQSKRLAKAPCKHQQLASTETNPALTRSVDSSLQRLRAKSARRAENEWATRQEQDSVVRKSVLDLTLPGAWGLPQSTVDRLWVEFDREECSSLQVSERVWEELSPEVLFREEPLSCFLGITTGILARSRLSEESFNELLKAMSVRVWQVTGEVVELSAQGFTDSAWTVNNDQLARGDMPLRWFSLPRRWLRYANEAGIETWRDLRLVSELDLFHRHGFTIKAIRGSLAIQHLLVIANTTLKKEMEAISSSYVSWDVFRDSLLASVCKNERQKAAVAGRWGLMDQRSRTLQEVGDVIGTTRERVRQIEAKVLDRVNRSTRTRDFLIPFWLVVREIIADSGGACFLATELAERISLAFKWTERPAPALLEHLVETRSTFKFDNDTGIVSQPQQECLYCVSAAELFAG